MRLFVAAEEVYVDTIILQALQDDPRWERQGALLHYAPNNYVKVLAPFRHIRAAYYGFAINAWSTVWHTDKISNPPSECPDFLKPEYKNKLVLTHRSDDDAIAYIFDLVMHQYGYEWFDRLLERNPRWVRGTGSPPAVLRQLNTSQSVTFTAVIGLRPSGTLSATFPTEGNFVSWARPVAIFKDAPHPESAKRKFGLTIQQLFISRPSLLMFLNSESSKAVLSDSKIFRLRRTGTLGSLWTQ